MALNDDPVPPRKHPFLIDYPMNRVLRAYPPGLIRLYCIIRSHILRNHILAEIGQYIPDSGNVLELGCGFGLFSNCFGMSHPGVAFHCVDKSEGRIQKARAVAAQCHVENVTFVCADAREAIDATPRLDCIFMFDLVHHLPPGSIEPFLEHCWSALKPGGLLIVKDVSDRPWHKMAFTWILDVLMTLGERPHYLSPERFLGIFTSFGAEVRVHRINDYLPYPHILYICAKPFSR